MKLARATKIEALEGLTDAIWALIAIGEDLKADRYVDPGRFEQVAGTLSAFSVRQRRAGFRVLNGAGTNPSPASAPAPRRRSPAPAPERPKASP